MNVQGRPKECSVGEKSMPTTSQVLVGSCLNEPHELQGKTYQKRPRLCLSLFLCLSLPLSFPFLHLCCFLSLSLHTCMHTRTHVYTRTHTRAHTHSQQPVLRRVWKVWKDPASPAESGLCWVFGTTAHHFPFFQVPSRAQAGCCHPNVPILSLPHPQYRNPDKQSLGLP